MVEPAGHCPYLGLKQNRAIRFASPTPEHRCYIGGDPIDIPVDQGQYCLSANHIRCPLYTGLTLPTTGDAPPRPTAETLKPISGPFGWFMMFSPRDRVIYLALIGLIGLIIVTYLYVGLQTFLAGPEGTGPTAAPTESPAPTGPTATAPAIAPDTPTVPVATPVPSPTLAATTPPATAPTVAPTAAPAPVVVPTTTPIPLPLPPTRVAPRPARPPARATAVAPPPTAVPATAVPTTVPPPGDLPLPPVDGPPVDGPPTAQPVLPPGSDLPLPPLPQPIPAPAVPTIAIPLPGQTIMPPLPEPQAGAPAPRPPALVTSEIVTLYFGDSTGSLYVPVQRAIRVENRQVALAAVRELIAGPRSGLQRLLLPDLHVLGVAIENGTARVNLDRYPTGQGDTRGFYAIVFTLTEFPSIQRVQLQVNGRNIGINGAGPIARPTINPINPQALANDVRQTSFLPLYFLSNDGAHSIRLIRMVPKTQQTAEGTLRALLDGPAGYAYAVQRTIPAGVELRGLRLEHGVVIVDFTQPFADAANRDAAVRTITQSLTTLPNVRGVQFLVEGHTLADWWGQPYGQVFGRPLINPD